MFTWTFLFPLSTSSVLAHRWWWGSIRWWPRFSFPPSYCRASASPTTASSAKQAPASLLQALAQITSPWSWAHLEWMKGMLYSCIPLRRTNGLYNLLPTYFLVHTKAGIYIWHEDDDDLHQQQRFKNIQEVELLATLSEPFLVPLHCGSHPVWKGRWNGLKPVAQKKGPLLSKPASCFCRLLFAEALGGRHHGKTDSIIPHSLSLDTLRSAQCSFFF